MKKVQLIEISVLAVALICGYKFFESLISIAITALYQFTNGYGDSWTIIIQYIFLTVLYFAGFIWLVRKRKWIAGYIYNQGQLKPELFPEEVEKVNLSIQQPGLLYIILVASCLLTIITEIPTILIYVYDYFKSIAGGRQKDLESFGKGMSYINFKVAAVKIVVTIVVLLYARPVTEWFTKSLTTEMPVIETNNES
jgi:hypothetical protein